MKIRSRIACVVLAAALFAACGGGGSSSSESTSKTRTKNAALPTTTLDLATSTVPADSPTTTTPAIDNPTTTTASESPTTTSSVSAPPKVNDPGNFSPTYLASTDPLGAPRVVLPAEASVTGNASKVVSAQYATDAAGILSVTKAEWVGTSTPMTLRWTVGGVTCDNCAFLSAGSKKIVKALLALKVDGSGIKSISGVDPSAVGLGQFSGNGWSIEAVVGDPGSVATAAAGNSILEWALSCSGDTASTCRNVDLGIGELRWKNEVWTVADCTSALQNGGPRILIADVKSQLKGASAEAAALVRQRAALDRVVLSAPIYRPVFATSGTTKTFTGFASTGCAK